MDRIKQLLGGVGSSIVALVSVIFNLVDTFIDLARSLSDFITRGLGDLLGWVGSFGWRAYNGVLGLERWAGDFARDITARIASDIGNVYERGERFARGLVREAVEFANRGVGDLLNWVGNIGWTAWHKVLGLEDWAGRFVSDITARIASDIGNVYDRAERFAKGAVADAVGFVQEHLVSPITNVVDEWIPLLKKVKDWLVFLAEHPFDWWIVLLRNVVERYTGGFVGWIVGAVDREMDKVDDWIGRWLNP